MQTVESKNHQQLYISCDTVTIIMSHFMSVASAILIVSKTCSIGRTTYLVLYLLPQIGHCHYTPRRFRDHLKKEDQRLKETEGRKTRTKQCLLGLTGLFHLWIHCNCLYDPQKSNPVIILTRGEGLQS